MPWKYAAAGLAAIACAATNSAALGENTIKIGFVIPMSGQQSAVGRQVAAGARLYMQQHGDTVAGKKIELIIRDDGGVPDTAKRVAQELLINEKVQVLGGGLTPSAFAMAPLATEAKVPEIVLVSGTSGATERSPYIVRVSFTLGQSSAILADWAATNGSRRVVIVQSDWAPGAEASAVFGDHFKKAGGAIVETVKVPLANPDFAPFLQRVRDIKPDTLFVFIPAWQAGAFAKQFIERGMDKSGIRLIGPGEITDDDNLNGMGDSVIGTITAGNYSTSHASAMNQAYVATFKTANNGLRPNFLSLGGYDGMHVVYEALRRTDGSSDGDKLLAAMKGITWESPRGPISIDAETRDIVQNIYLRKVERVDGELYNTEFATFEAVKDPTKAERK